MFYQVYCLCFQDDKVLKASSSDPALDTAKPQIATANPEINPTSCEDLDLRKTKLKAARTDVRFDESFEFNVEEKHSYLNLLLWCRYTNRADKMTKGSKLPDKDVLLGHVRPKALNR